MAEVGRPSQKAQSSRKGKKAWRKNIDIDEVELAMEAQREEIRTFGESAETLKSSELFQIDVTRDSDSALKYQSKKLKADEIIARRSKVSGLTHPKKIHETKKFQGVSGKETNRLMKLAGRVQGVTASQAMIESHGLNTKEKAYDVWGSDKKEIKKQATIPKILNDKSTSSYTKAKVVPKTLKEAPIKVKEVESIPHAGKSYNPSLPSWKNLVNNEYGKEKTKEDERVALEKHKERIQFLIETLVDNEEESDDEEQSDNEEIDPESRVSINKPVTNKKKTRAQRNRTKRHEERMKLEEELKSLKKQISELQKLKDIEEEVKNKEEETALAKEKNASKKRKSHKLGTKYHVIENNELEIKLSDELNDSLRKLKPEGNLLYDQVRKLQGKGKIETRLPVIKRRRYTPKVTEKWSYKDFK